MNKTVWLFVSVAVLGAFGGALYSRMTQHSEPAASYTPEPAREVLGQPRPPYTLGAIDGQRVSAEEFDGRVVLVNFWATWCVPCRKEMPMLADLQDRYSDQGLSVVGIALDDVGKARSFATEFGIDYTILVGAADVMATNAVYGNRTGALPYTVLIDRDGIIRWTYLGELEQRELQSQLETLL